MSDQDRDYAEQNYRTATQLLGEARSELQGAPTQAIGLGNAVHSGITKAVKAINTGSAELDRWLKDETVYPKGRYEKASAAYDHAAEVVQRELATAQGAARVMGHVLEQAVVPTFVGDDAEQGRRRDEIRDIVNRSNDPAQALAELAREERYAGLVVSFGRSLLLGRGMEQRTIDRSIELVRSEALASAIDHGTPEQRQAAARVAVAEKFQWAHVAAADACRWRLESMAAKVEAARAKASRAG
jgi:hypothetical protein